MNKRNRRRIPEQRSIGVGNLLSSLQPLISLGILIAGLVVWSYNTFAQINYVKEQNIDLNLKIEQIKIESNLKIEQLKRDATIYSDQNRERIFGILMEVKESVRIIENRMITK